MLPGRRFLERLELRDLAELMDLPLDGVARGEPTGAGALEDDLLLLACTHGTRDPCCAKNGLPLHRALSAAAPARVWHSSHLGGHRFAPTMACLPLGIWLGRLPAARARDVVAGLRGGRLPLEHVRGRAGLPAEAQAAELALRRRLGLTRDDAVSCRGAGDGTVRLDTPEGASWIAHVTLAPTGRERPLSCGVGARMEDPGAFRVVLEPAAAG